MFFASKSFMNRVRSLKRRGSHNRMRIMSSGRHLYLGSFLLWLCTIGCPLNLRAQKVAIPPPESLDKLSPAKVDRPGFPPVPKFKDVASEVGLTGSHISTGEKRFIIESM